MRAVEQDRSIPELSTVALTHSLTDPESERVLPEGATGTVVFVYHDGVGYEVEFDEPFHSVVTLERDDIRPA